MFIVGIILLLLAIFIAISRKESVQRNGSRFDQNRKDYCELRAQGVQPSETKYPKFKKSNHAFFEITFIVLIILAILFMIYPEQSSIILHKIPHLFVWFYFGPY